MWYLHLIYYTPLLRKWSYSKSQQLLFPKGSNLKRNELQYEELLKIMSPCLFLKRFSFFIMLTGFQIFKSNNNNNNKLVFKV